MAPMEVQSAVGMHYPSEHYPRRGATAKGPWVLWSEAATYSL